MFVEALSAQGWTNNATHPISLSMQSSGVADMMLQTSPQSAVSNVADFQSLLEDIMKLQLAQSAQGVSESCPPTIQPVAIAPVPSVCTQSAPVLTSAAVRPENGAPATGPAVPFVTLEDNALNVVVRQPAAQLVPVQAAGNAIRFLGAPVQVVAGTDGTLLQSEPSAAGLTSLCTQEMSMVGNMDCASGVCERSGPFVSLGLNSTGSPTKRQHSLYKTELCRSWEETGTCRYGNKCQFAHGREELRFVQRHPKYKTEVCRTFATTGTCPYGTRCRFIHPTSSSTIGGGTEDKACIKPMCPALSYVPPANNKAAVPRRLSLDSSAGLAAAVRRLPVFAQMSNQEVVLHGNKHVIRSVSDITSLIEKYGMGQDGDPAAVCRSISDVAKLIVQQQEEADMATGHYGPSSPCGPEGFPLGTASSCESLSAATCSSPTA